MQGRASENGRIPANHLLSLPGAGRAPQRRLFGSHHRKIGKRPGRPERAGHPKQDRRTVPRIDCRIRRSCWWKKKGATPKSSAVDELLEGVSDPVLRARINLLIADLESTRAQLLAARHLASKNSVLVLSGPEALATAPAQPDAALTSQEKKSFAAAISEKTLEHWGWLIDSNGRSLPIAARSSSVPASLPQSIHKGPHPAGFRTNRCTSSSHATVLDKRWTSCPAKVQ